MSHLCTDLYHYEIILLISGNISWLEVLSDINIAFLYLLFVWWIFLALYFQSMLFFFNFKMWFNWTTYYWSVLYIYFNSLALKGLFHLHLMLLIFGCRCIIFTMFSYLSNVVLCSSFVFPILLYFNITNFR